MVVQLLSNKEDAFENIRILWRDVIDTTGVNTVQELFQRFEKEKRRMLSAEEVKELLWSLAYVEIKEIIFSKLQRDSSSVESGNFINASLKYQSTSDHAETGFHCNKNSSCTAKHGATAAKVPVTNICRGPQFNEEQVFDLQTQFQKLSISSGQAPSVPVNSQMFSDGVMVTGQRVVKGKETPCEISKQQILRENEALKVQLKELQEVIEKKESALLKKDKELSQLNCRLAEEIMMNDKINEELKKVNAEMARRTGDRDMDVGTGTMRNQENLMVTENTRLKTPSETSYHSNSVMQAFYAGTEFLKLNNSSSNDEGPSVPAALETGQVVAQLQTLEEENKVLKAKLRELEKNLKRREERIREKEDEVRSIKVRITKKATRNRRTEEELRNKKRELERIKVDLERTHYEKRTAEEVKVLIPEVQRCEVRINEVKEEWRGAKGKVMRGKVRDIEVVIKEPLSTKLEAFKAFKRESDIISQLDHPNVVRCHATFDEHDGQSPWIVQEYANGVTLGYHLNKRLFTLVPFEVLSFALDAGRGLLYLHTLPSPIVHGDLHSGNLLLFIIGSTPPVLKLCDFGKATILGNTMPPNQGPSKKDDVLSFGKLLSDMLLKIKWPDWMARQEQVYFRTSLEQLIERCTKEIPESRPDMQKVVDDLKDLENRYSNFPGQVEQDPVEKYLITKTSFNRH